MALKDHLKSVGLAAIAVAALFGIYAAGIGIFTAIGAAVGWTAFSIGVVTGMVTMLSYMPLREKLEKIAPEFGTFNVSTLALTLGTVLAFNAVAKHNNNKAADDKALDNAITACAEKGGTYEVPRTSGVTLTLTCPKK